MFFGTMWHQKFRQKVVMPPVSFILKIFRCQKPYETKKGPSTKFFGTLRKKIQRNWWYPLPMQKMFRYQKFSETRKGSATIFFGAVRQNFSIEISDMPFLCIRFFDARFFLKHTRVPLRNFLVMRDKFFKRKICNTLPLLLSKKIEITDIFWNREVIPYDFFRYCETNKLTKYRDTHPSSLIHKSVRYPKFSETHKGSPTNFFGTVRQKLWQKIVILPPLLLSTKLFDTRSFLKQRGVHLWIFSTLRHKKLSTKKCDNPFLCVRFFDTPFFLTHRRVPWGTFL